MTDKALWGQPSKEMMNSSIPITEISVRVNWGTRFRLAGATTDAIWNSMLFIIRYRCVAARNG